MILDVLQISRDVWLDGLPVSRRGGLKRKDVSRHDATCRKLGTRNSSDLPDRRLQCQHILALADRMAMAMGASEEGGPGNCALENQDCSIRHSSCEIFFSACIE